MKKYILSLAILSITSLSFSQAPINKGATQLNLGVGFSEYTVPFYIGFDHCVAKDLTLGAEASYRAYNEHWKDDYYDHSILGFSGNLNYHFNSILRMPSRWDLYAGANIGFYVWNTPNGYRGNHSSGLGVGAQIGARYYFSDRLGINLEFGGANAFSGGKIGLSIRL